MFALASAFASALMLTSAAWLFAISQQPRRSISNVWEILFFFLIDFEYPDPKPLGFAWRWVPYFVCLALNTVILSVYGNNADDGFWFAGATTAVLAGYFFWLSWSAAKRTKLDMERKKRLRILSESENALAVVDELVADFETFVRDLENSLNGEIVDLETPGLAPEVIVDTICQRMRFRFFDRELKWKKRIFELQMSVLKNKVELSTRYGYQVDFAAFIERWRTAELKALNLSGTDRFKQWQR